MYKDFKILNVDLDGTLINTDMLYETFWSAFANDLLIPFKAFVALLGGIANLKNFLFRTSLIDIKSLPYNEEVIRYINSYRSKGGKVVLITATNEELAKKISDYLNLFDEVYGSTSRKNLKGIYKANFQKEIYGIKKYDYIGNSFDDIYSWKGANTAITIDASNYLKKSCEKINSNCIHLKTKNKSNFLRTFLREIRLYQWIKNSLIFLPLLASQQLELDLVINSFEAFFSFSLLASSVYIFNDLLDLKADRVHPNKCKRPFASGELSIKYGSIGGLCLLSLGFIIGSNLGPDFIQCLLLYYTVTVSYSLYFKKKELFDIFILSGLYTIRILAGGAATDLQISFWLLAFSIFIFLSLASVKREAELIDLVERGKIQIQGRGYKTKDLNFISLLSICSGLLSSLVLALYINSPKVLDLYQNPKLLWIVCCLFLFWIIRICFKTSRGEMDDDPIIFALKDKISNIIFLSSLILVALATVT